MRFKNGIREKDIIIKCAADKFLPFSVMFGIYIILFGTISPGGGFQGGVIAAGGVLLVFLGYGYKNAENVFKPNVLRIKEALGATVYVLLALIGIIVGANFARNIFYDLGNKGDLISGGNITFMGYTVGFKVLAGVSFLILLLLALLSPDADEDYGFEEEEEE